MYRQILVNPQHIDFQRIFWQFKPHDPIISYRLLTVTYGTACAPFLAIRTFHELAKDYNSEFPLAAQSIPENFYVDDFLGGSSTIDSAKQWVADLNHVLSQGGFTLRNSQIDLLKSIGISKYLNCLISSKHQTEIHGFCDGSGKAYAAVVYLPTLSSSGDISVNFVAAKTRPSDVYSENGKKFKVVANYLKQLFQIIRSETIQSFAASHFIHCHFIPPYSPHFGGLWEAAVKLTKAHLIKACKTTILNFEDLTTLLCQIAACLNFRPLTPLSSDPADVRALTPVVIHDLQAPPLQWKLGRTNCTHPGPDLRVRVVSIRTQDGEKFSVLSLRSLFFSQRGRKFRFLKTITLKVAARGTPETGDCLKELLLKK
ncbi:integrase catalytic domain-containing protein [Trichonephila clavipes]|nr:integrase catalytic domain-containing protein [Trichonephila clavipes]